MTIPGSHGNMVLGGSVTTSLGIGTATSSGSIAVWTRHAGTVGKLGDLLLDTGTKSVGGSGASVIGSGLPASSLGGSSAILVGSSTNNGVAFSVTASNLLGASGGDAAIVSRL